ncbi:NADH-quinone oxidoreductase subunit NuoG [Amphiplicatus metriothermophilus]|uniref:NADH-quinone oxidoreductase n=1 Tax=Amphiplicatus metriothermophilus TaxID=1519374 RepID=A0A239PWX5_9PROT|nr:NADH-quinone oxidoreductase subunit NuoG [Amphiplicatus metriothermophilus]MBB5519066.1 NADH-quinone oxidoreductase subunit G [Amphiplicatus metriothermophilus]SNT74755.1 NADH dehydrogenase subunit G [Amphiplicatus metriothermophilus]
MSDTRVIKVNGREIEVPASLTLLQACELAGEEIPRFCYHERLSVAGNCRMCLIEVKGGPPKPVASCAQNVRDLRPGPDGAPPELFTNTPMVKKAREGVMEFLLINHPLDCPICDQGGECDLQDQAMAYGRDGSRYSENKRAVEEKYMGPLIKTIMTRCIQCTRCVRFATEIAGVDDLGLVNRGEDAEITTYLEKAIESELTGNLIDICPVGALTSRPYAFNARPWELTKTETIDVMDAVGSNIRVDVRGREVMRILPRVHEDVNEEWISDKTRFIWDGLKRQRLDTPYIRENGKLRPARWDEALSLVAEKLKTTPADKIAAVVGDLVPTEAVKALKDLMTALGTPHMDCRQDGAPLGIGVSGAERASYLFNTGIAGLERADAIVLVGTNPRIEAALVNARIRKAWLANINLKIGLVGEAANLTYDYEHLGDGPQTLAELAAGRGAFFETLKNAERPVVIIGMGAIARPDGLAVLAEAAKLAEAVGATREDWNGFNILHTAAARVGALDLRFLPGESGKDFAGILKAAQDRELEVVYNLGADEIDPAKWGGVFMIYQGHHGDAGARAADVILPGAAYTEQNGIYVNTEGRAQIAFRAHFPYGEAREDWAIVRALSERVGKTLPYDDLFALRQAMIADAPSLGRIDQGPEEGAPIDLSKVGKAGDLSPAPFRSPVRDFYFTNAIARASKTMAECSAVMMRAHRMAAE